MMSNERSLVLAINKHVDILGCLVPSPAIKLVADAARQRSSPCSCKLKDESQDGRTKTHHLADCKR